MSFFNHQVSQLAANLIFRFQLNKLIELTHGIINTTCAMMIDLTSDCGPVALVGPIAWIGLFEGGYHHALKVILFQLDLPVSTLQRLYPPGIYEPLEALFFEATGVAQLLLAVWAPRSLVEFARVSRAGGVE